MTDRIGAGSPLVAASAQITAMRGGANPTKIDSPERIRQAAEQFEALLIGQMLKSAREAGSSGGLGTEDNAGQTGMEMAEQQFAGLLASKGGLGLSRFITSNLERRSG